MQTATDRASHRQRVVSRRGWLAQLTQGAVWMTAMAAGVGGARRAWASDLAGATEANCALVAACWTDTKGRHFAGWLLPPGGQGVDWQVVRSVELPTRGHGLAVLTHQTLLVVARRPGDWLLRLPLQGAPHWHWMESGRVLNGHVTLSADGQRLLSTELDLERGVGVVGVRNAVSLEKLAEYESKGLDPHSIIDFDAFLSGVKGSQNAVSELGRTIWVANGGIEALLETGRTKHRVSSMDSSIACLSADTGECLGQWRVPDARLSLRHMAWAHTASGGWVLGVAMQAEHEHTATRAAAPLLATLDWKGLAASSLTLATAQPPLGGYGGDIGVMGRGTNTRFVVSATQGHRLAAYGLQGRFECACAWPRAGALAMEHGQGWVAGMDGWSAVNGMGQGAQPWADLGQTLGSADGSCSPPAPAVGRRGVHFDNHALLWSGESF